MYSWTFICFQDLKRGLNSLSVLQMPGLLLLSWIIKKWPFTCYFLCLELPLTLSFLLDYHSNPKNKLVKCTQSYHDTVYQVLVALTAVEVWHLILKLFKQLVSVFQPWWCLAPCMFLCQITYTPSMVPIIGTHTLSEWNL